MRHTVNTSRSCKTGGEEEEEVEEREEDSGVDLSLGYVKSPLGGVGGGQPPRQNTPSTSPAPPRRPSDLQECGAALDVPIAPLQYQ